ncbi:hypothetical protein H2198_008886 [Neophaeococcomyces mojaviensis]|uniref:Uncharacterized protein n=1 Tax=Neophaeococcomyces mojaviensis TaxID=3383035 RepID=A0ACC2ZWD3_9EURO|nr:hypothetical protein H2198_008886 [Knufia sp. JES_112]
MAIFDRILATKRDDLEITSPYDDYKDDCSTALVSAGGWTYFSGMKQLRERQKLIEKSRSKYKYGSRQLGIVTLSATFVGLGIYRMLN